MERFRWLTENSAPRIAPWDVDLTPSDLFATVPSKGAIVDGWLLTLPRYSAINIASLPVEKRRAILSQAQRTAVQKKKEGKTTFFFEHGPVALNTLTGCGVDHAHLHSVPVKFDIFEDLPKAMNWQNVSSDDPWSTLGKADYLVIGNGNNWLACEPKKPESQFFRKLIARRVTGGYGWDHNERAWSENVRKTISQFAK